MLFLQALKTLTTEGYVMTTTKLRASGEVRIPAAIISKHHLRQGDVLDVHDSAHCIVFIPKKVKQMKSKASLFELIEKTRSRSRVIDSRALDRVINRAVRAARAGERKRSSVNA